jgi:D-alanyl-D-alanine carboxypeptidase
VWIPGRGSFVRAQSVRDVATAEAFRSDDVVRIGSITKAFVATLVLQLVDDGLLSLDDTLEQFAPGLPHAREITIRQLLGMTTGVANFLEDPGFLAAYEADLLMPFSPQQGLAIARTKTPAFVPAPAATTRRRTISCSGWSSNGPRA